MPPTKARSVRQRSALSYLPGFTKSGISLGNGLRHVRLPCNRFDECGISAPGRITSRSDTLDECVYVASHQPTLPCLRIARASGDEVDIAVRGLLKAVEAREVPGEAHVE